MADDETTKGLLNDQHEPPEDMDAKSLHWAADYAWAMANEEKGHSPTALHAFTHVMRGHARSRERADNCCAWCRKLPPLEAFCPKRPKNNLGRRCRAAKDVRDGPGCFSRAECEATAEHLRSRRKGLDG